jgi:putative ABC transport system permease protein
MLSSVSLRIKPGDVSATLASVENTWKALSPDFPFEYEFADEAMDRLYKQDDMAGTMFSVFATMGIGIACMGLFGLASFTTWRRTKEIGIRKVLGAGTYSIVWLLLKEFIAPILLALLIASPVAYFSVYVWLENFAYHIPLNAIPFVYAGLLVMLVAIFTVSYQSIIAALSNPVKSLRSE